METDLVSRFDQIDSIDANLHYNSLGIGRMAQTIREAVGAEYRSVTSIEISLYTQKEKGKGAQAGTEENGATEKDGEAENEEE